MQYTCRRKGQETEGEVGGWRENCLGLRSRFCADSASAPPPGLPGLHGLAGGGGWESERARCEPFSPVSSGS